MIECISFFALFSLLWLAFLGYFFYFSFSKISLTFSSIHLDFIYQSSIIILFLFAFLTNLLHQIPCSLFSLSLKHDSTNSFSFITFFDNLLQIISLLSFNFFGNIPHWILFGFITISLKNYLISCFAFFSFYHNLFHHCHTNPYPVIFLRFGSKKNWILKRVWEVMIRSSSIRKIVWNSNCGWIIKMDILKGKRESDDNYLIIISYLHKFTWN